MILGEMAVEFQGRRVGTVRHERKAAGERYIGLLQGNQVSVHKTLDEARAHVLFHAGMAAISNMNVSDTVLHARVENLVEAVRARMQSDEDARTYLLFLLMEYQKEPDDVPQK